MIMMKKIITRAAALVLALAASASSLSAQLFEKKLAYRAELDLGVSSISHFGTGKASYGPRVSGQVLATFRHSDFGVLTGLTLLQKGEKDVYYHQAQGQGDISSWYIQLPIHASYKLHLDLDNDLFIEAGPHFGYGLSGTLKGFIPQATNPTADATDLKVFDKGNGEAAFNRFDLGVGLNLAYKYKNYFLRLGIETSITDVVNKNHPDLAPRIKDKSTGYTNIYFGVGYQF